MIKRPYIIAEAGFNHEGSMDVACRMVEEAARAGAGAIKFQSFHAAELSAEDSPHFKLIEKGELSEKDHRRLTKQAADCGIDFLSTPYDPASVDLLDDLGVCAFKIASMDVTNLPLLAHVAGKGKKVYLSTGMSLIGEIDRAVSVLKENGLREIVLLHCISLYPAEPEQLNLRAVETLKRIWGLPVGYSDHSLGIFPALTAIALGAEVVEKHFTLDKTLPGPDHKISADPADLALLVQQADELLKCLGSGLIGPERADRANAGILRRGVYARRRIEPDEPLRMDMLRFIRPVDKISPGEVDSLLGRCPRHPIEKNSAIRPEMF